MSTTVSYKGSTIATISNATKTLQTSGKWMEDDVTITDTPSSPSLQLIKTVSLGTLTTSSTSATDTGKTIEMASSTGWSDYDLLLVDISVNSVTNGRHTSSVGFVFLTGTSNVNTKNTYAVGSNVWNSKVSSSGTKSTRQSSTKYGIYSNAATVANNTLTLTVYYRYNSNHTGTINNAYTARVYGIKLIDLIGG